MGENSKIQWTDHTFNPWIGCTKVSPGCDNCYAERLGKRLGVQWGAGQERRLAATSTWKQVLGWDLKAARDCVRRRVFCASLADVFDNAVPQSWRDDLWSVILDTPHLDWALLTKRIGNVPKMLPCFWRDGWHNVSIGISLVNQEEADRDVPKLLTVPATQRFLSCEPLLGPIDLTRIGEDEIGAKYDSLRGGMRGGAVDDMGGPRLDWVIVGGESGPKARPCNVEWIRSIVEQCKTAGVPVFVKQLGARPVVQHPMQVGALIDVKCADRKGGDPDEWPENLWVREFPKVKP